MKDGKHMQCIHLAGTNGKGSTALYLANILGESHKCGLFTSPHIFTPRERFAIDGEMISQADYDSYMSAAGRQPGEHWFSVWVRVAQKWFADNAVDYAVIETGLGGSRDQTNFFDSAMQIITPVSLDHTAELGNDVRKIALEKAGIIKWGATVVSHPQQADAAEVIRRTCDHLDNLLIVLDDKKIRLKQAAPEGQVFDFSYRDLDLRRAEISAISPAQLSNACVAAVAARELGIDPDDIAMGLKKTVIAARAQYIDGMLIDAAHNEAAILELKRTVKKYFAKKNITVLTAVMEDKDISAIAGGIDSFADNVICTCADKKRGLAASEYAKYFDDAFAMEDPAYAFDYAKETAERKKGMLVVCGSFYLLPYVM